MIIGLVGWIGSGKDTVADYLVNFHGFRRESFASTLKDSVSAVFGWDRVLLEGKTRESRSWRDQVDFWWADRLQIPHLTPRWVLQHWGTEVCRHGFHSEIWIASLENKLRNTQDDIVISDCRFVNEIQALRDLGGKVGWIQRGKFPDWYQTAIKANMQDADSYKTMQQTAHHSEWAWVGTEFDFILDNNGSVQDLYESITNQVLDRQISSQH